MSLRAAKVFQAVDDLNGDVLVQDNALGVVVAVEKARQYAQTRDRGRFKNDSHHLQDAPHHMRRHDDGGFCVDGGETVEEDVGAVDFVRQWVRSVGGRSGRSDRRSYRHNVAPVGIREPARCFASTKDVLCHQELPTVTLRERDEICFAASSISIPIARSQRKSAR